MVIDRAANWIGGALRHLSRWPGSYTAVLQIGRGSASRKRIGPT